MSLTIKIKIPILKRSQIKISLTLITSSYLRLLINKSNLLLTDTMKATEIFTETLAKTKGLEKEEETRQDHQAEVIERET